MKILSIIPARGGSKGVPGKNLIKIGGIPLLKYTLTASLESESQRSIVSTDDEQIKKNAISYGGEVILRPKRISGDKSQIESAMEHVLNHLEKHENYIPDIVILLQNTSPFRTAQDINNALKLFRKFKYDSVLSGYTSHDLVWEKKYKLLKPVNYNPLKRPNRQEMKKQFIENGAIYITKYNLFKKTKCRISGKIGLLEMSQETSLQIDTKFDLFLAEQYIKWRKIER